MYVGMTNGTIDHRKTMSSINTTKTKRNFNSFPFKVHVENFSAIILRFETKRKQLTSESPTKKLELTKSGAFIKNADSRIAFAGVGNPLNSFDASDKLNLASLSAENGTINNGIIISIDRSEIGSFMKLKTANAGRTPKEIKSAKESNCLPNSDWAFSNLADNPSEKSKSAAIRTKYMATVGSSITLKQPKVPTRIFRLVRKLGTCRFILSQTGYAVSHDQWSFPGHVQGIQLRLQVKCKLSL